MNFTFSHFIPTEDGGEIILEIDAEYDPGCPASGPRGERPINPPEPPSIEITSITQEGDDFAATPGQLDDILEAAWDHLPTDDDRY